MFAAGTAVATALIVGITFGAWQAVRAGRELRRALAAQAHALTEKANVQAALHFVQDDVLSQASPGFQPDRDLQVSTLLDRVAERLDRATDRPPLVEGSIRQTPGSVYTELGDYTKAVQHYEKALQLQRQRLVEDHSDSLRSVYGLVMARWWSGSMVQAEEHTRRGLEASSRILGKTNALTLQFRRTRPSPMVYSGAVPWAEIEPRFLEALAMHREVPGPDSPATLRLIYDLGLGCAFNFRPAMGAPLVAEGLRRSSRWTNNTRRQPG